MARKYRIFYNYKANHKTNLEPRTLNFFEQNLIRFDTYTQFELFEIFKYRTKISLNDFALSNELMEKVVLNTLNDGNVKRGLNLLKIAADIADKKGLISITPEIIELSINDDKLNHV